MGKVVLESIFDKASYASQCTLMWSLVISKGVLYSVDFDIRQAY